MRYWQVAALSAAMVLAGGSLAVRPAAAETTEAKNDIWQDEPQETARPWWQRDLTDDVIDRIMKGLQQRDPAKARELSELRQKDPERFKAELREQGRPEMDQMISERLAARRQERNTRFLEWLKGNYPAEEQALAKLKEANPQLYVTSFERVMSQYGYIFDAASSSPELGNVLKEDLELKRRAMDLCKQIRSEKSDAKRQALGAELQEVVARRYDLIVRRKEIAYEQLQKKLDELQRQVRESKDEITKWRDEKIRQENIKQRLKTLTDEKARFKWD
jgi:chorismate-pyruvate lyase